MLIDRQIDDFVNGGPSAINEIVYMQSAFLPELRRWISKLTARHLHACPPGDLLITMVKETVILYKKEFRKMKKSYLSLI